MYIHTAAVRLTQIMVIDRMVLVNMPAIVLFVVRQASTHTEPTSISIYVTESQHRHTPAVRDTHKFDSLDGDTV